MMCWKLELRRRLKALTMNMNKCYARKNNVSCNLYSFLLAGCVFKIADLIA